MREAIKNSPSGRKGCTYSWRDSGQLGGTQMGWVERGHEDEQGLPCTETARAWLVYPNKMQQKDVICPEQCEYRG